MHSNKKQTNNNFKFNNINTNYYNNIYTRHIYYSSNKIKLKPYTNIKLLNKNTLQKIKKWNSNIIIITIKMN